MMEIALFLAGLAVGAFATNKILSWKDRQRRKVAWFSSLRNPEAQLAYVKQGNFSGRPIMGKQEYLLYTILFKWLSNHFPDYRLFPQVCMGSFLRTPKSGGEIQENAFSAINSKRHDFVIIDRFGFVVCAVEYQGDGHYILGERGHQMDKVKQIALHNAGLVYVDAFPSDLDNAAHLKNQLLSILRQAQKSSSASLA